MSEKRLVIAIDGPSGAGKSTIARLLSQSLDIAVLDTGAMYRALALAASRTRVDLGNGAALARLASEHVIAFVPPALDRVSLDGEDISDVIRTLEIGQAASRLSVHPEVRRAMVARQQELIAGSSFILEGRDTTTVVAPNADLKVFLTASIEERARRRWLELYADGGPSLQDVVKEVVERDHRDYTRSDSPLALAEDAVIVESFGLTPYEVMGRILALVESS